MHLFGLDIFTCVKLTVHVASQPCEVLNSFGILAFSYGGHSVLPDVQAHCWFQGQNELKTGIASFIWALGQSLLRAECQDLVKHAPARQASLGQGEEAQQAMQKALGWAYVT